MESERGLGGERGADELDKDRKIKANDVGIPGSTTLKACPHVTDGAVVVDVDVGNVEFDEVDVDFDVVDEFGDVFTVVDFVDVGGGIVCVDVIKEEEDEVEEGEGETTFGAGIVLLGSTNFSKKKACFLNFWA